MHDHSVTSWLKCLRNGDGDAAAKLWSRYASKLIRLARQEIRDVSVRVADEEDIVQDVFQTFFRAMSDGKLPGVTDRKTLWPLLIFITRKRAINERKHWACKKRGSGKVRGDSALRRAGCDTGAAGFSVFASSSPSPEEEVFMAEQLDTLLQSLKDSTLQRIAVMKLEGWANADIALELGISRATVWRKLEVVRSVWLEELE